MAVEIQSPLGAASKGVNKIPIFCFCLSIVTPLTQRLPVALIPKQSLVTSVRFGVIYHRCFGERSFLFTVLAKRISVQESFSCLPPAVIVTTLARIRSIIYMKLCMKLAVLIIGQQRAAVVFAGLLWFFWHCSQLQYSIKKAPKDLPSRARVYTTFTPYTISQEEGGLTWLFMACFLNTNKNVKKAPCRSRRPYKFYRLFDCLHNIIPEP
ncbi:hypothetical protein [Peribacillus cavernae]|uniref:hypothetical protein n=1 Tax=Peribacillus cavernae TaxID=1674310 RepID=UPI00278A1C8A|nr:hypothetical protein [Peribacillus cavernae]